MINQFRQSNRSSTKEQVDILSPPHSWNQLLDYIDRKINLVPQDVFALDKKKQQDSRQASKIQSSFDKVISKNIQRRVRGLIDQIEHAIKSVDFKLMHENKLTSKEAELFYCKNLLSNIKAIFSQIIKEITYNLDSASLQQYLHRIVKWIDEEVEKVVKQSAQQYASYTCIALTHRMQEAITPINRSTSQNDLISAQDIKISKYLEYSSEGRIINHELSYIPFIMQVLNSSLNNLKSKPSLTSNDTIHDKYVSFLQRLYFSSQHLQYRRTVNTILKTPNHPQQKQLISLFVDVFEDNELVKQISVKQKAKGVEYMFSQIKYEYPETYERMRKINQYLKPEFTFTPLPANMSEHQLVRALEKWIIHLSQIFEQPQRHITQTTCFKNTQNKDIYISKAVRRILIDRIETQRSKMKERVDSLFSQFRYIESYLLNRGSESVSWHRTNTPVEISADMMIGLLQRYLCILIHHLLLAGSQIQTSLSKTDVNLVSFIPNYMESTIHCNEASFISILNTLSILDRNGDTLHRLKLTKISNYLDKDENTLTIKLIFFGKVQCSLQLCLVQTTGKMAHYYHFNQFLNKLTNFKFGVIASCALFSSKDCPLTFNQFYMNKKRIKLKPTTEIRSQRIYHKNEIIYICRNQNCNELVINENIDLFDAEQTICNNCIFTNNKRPQTHLPKSLIIVEQTSDNQNSTQINTLPQKQNRITFINQIQKQNQSSDNQKDVNIFRLKSISDLNLIMGQKFNKDSDLKINSYVINLKIEEGHKKANLYRLHFNQTKWKPQLSLIDSSVLSSINQASSIEQVKSFFLEQHHLAATDQMYFLLKGKKLPNILDSLNLPYNTNQIRLFERRFKDYQKNKEVRRIIQSENQIIDVGGDREVYSYLLDALVNQKNNFHSAKIKHIKHFAKILSLPSMQLEKVDSPLEKLVNLTEMDLRDNKIRSMDLSLFSNLIHLNAGYNQLELITLRNNKKLQKLELDLNRLKQINLSNNVNLTHLNLSHNQLEQIDLNANIKLVQLILSNNYLNKKFELPKHADLTHLQVSFNRLSQIELTKNTKLQHVCLNFNDIRQLNLTQLPNLTFLNGSEMQLERLDTTANKKLTHLFLENNKLTSIDLSANLFLIHLNLSSNSIEKVNLSANKMLKTIELASTSIIEIDLKSNRQLLKLNLKKNKVKQLSLIKNIQLRELHLNQNKLQQIDLRNNTELTCLNLLNNSLASIDLTNNCKLQCIDIRNNFISEAKFTFTSRTTPKISMRQFSQKCFVTIYYQDEHEEQCMEFVKLIQKTYQLYKFEAVKIRCRSHIENA